MIDPTEVQKARVLLAAAFHFARLIRSEATIADSLNDADELLKQAQEPRELA